MEDEVDIAEMLKTIAEIRRLLTVHVELLRKHGFPDNIDKAIADLNELIDFVRDFRNMIEGEG